MSTEYCWMFNTYHNIPHGTFSSVEACVADARAHIAKNETQSLLVCKVQKLSPERHLSAHACVIVKQIVEALDEYTGVDNSVHVLPGAVPAFQQLLKSWGAQHLQARIPWFAGEVICEYFALPAETET